MADLTRMTHFLNLLPTGIRAPLQHLFNSGAALKVDIEGNVEGNVTGNLTGNVAGSLNGDYIYVDNIIGFLAALKLNTTIVSEDLDLDGTDFGISFIQLDGSIAEGSVDVINWVPTVGKFYVITCADATESNPTLTIANDDGTPVATFDGTNHIATFDAALETLILFCVTENRLLIILNQGTVGLSDGS